MKMAKSRFLLALPALYIQLILDVFYCAYSAQKCVVFSELSTIDTVVPLAYGRAYTTRLKSKYGQVVANHN